MHRLSIPLLLTALALGVNAQNYTFEADHNHWTAQQGTLSLSTDHYKQGTHSLCWEVDGRSQMVVSGFTAYSTSSSTSAFMHIYSPAVSNDTLVVEFMSGTSVRRTANYLLCYRGWREFNRTYAEYESTPTSSITALRFTYKPASAGSRKVYFDHVQLSTANDASRVPGPQWRLDAQWFKVNTTPLILSCNQPDLPLTTPTEQELQDLNTVRSRLRPEVGYNAMQATLAKNWVQKNIQITRLSDGTVTGTPIDLTSAHVAIDSVLTILDRVNYLAGGKMQNNEAMTQAFDDYVDLLIDQGFGNGLQVAFASNSYANPRSVLPKVVSVLPALSDSQRAEWVKLLRWLCFYDRIYTAEADWLLHVVSDEVYLFLTYQQMAAAFHVDDAEAVRELRAMSRYMNRCASYTPGGLDMLKPDGTGFHHNTHYNNYMYSYQTFCSGIYNLRNTCFEIPEEGYRHFGKAITSIYTMATAGKNDSRHYANTLCGRNPFAGGTTVYFTQSLFNQLIQSGDSYPEEQARLKGAYNYFYQTNTYADAPAVSFEGFHEFNYSPIGVMRNGSWVATMHAPTSRFWSAEIYSGQNRFGRYQGHGALEITYSGSTLAASGYPTNRTGGGWDWNVIPGTTTVHYTSWKDMMPSGNTSSRFDQYTNGTNFSGAAGQDMEGVWACNFNQKEAWGTASRYTPTNLVFKKSVFVFDSILVALGTDIAAAGNYDDGMITATNLFQNITTAASSGLLINGQTRSVGDSAVINATDTWILTPTNTGYFVPAGNDPLKVVYAQQKTPLQTGADATSPTTTATAAKAYLNHGVKTSGRRYEFVVVPATNAARMQALSAQIAAGTVYTVLSQSSKLHAVRAGSTIGYAFFDACDQLDFGIVRSTTHQHLLIDRTEADGSHRLTVCNPNLEPTVVANPAVSTYWTAKPTQTTLTLDGEWSLVEAVEGATANTPQNGQTTLDITFTDGLPLHLTLVPYNPSSLTEPSTLPFRLLRFPDKVRLVFDATSYLSSLTSPVCLYSAGGQLLGSYNPGGRPFVDIFTNDLPCGLYVCRLGGNALKFTK